MLPELTRDEKWQFVALKEHHNEHHMLESTAQADADRRRELLDAIGEWYTDSTDVRFRFMPTELLFRLREELADD